MLIAVPDLGDSRKYGTCGSMKRTIDRPQAEYQRIQRLKPYFCQPWLLHLIRNQPSTRHDNDCRERTAMVLCSANQDSFVVNA